MAGSSGAGSVIVWIDAQLSPAIAPWLTKEFGVEAYSVRFLNLLRAKDPGIFHKAREANIAVMTKDVDFVLLQERFGAPPSILWVRCGNTSNAYLKQVFATYVSRCPPNDRIWRNLGRDHRRSVVGRPTTRCSWRGPASGHRRLLLRAAPASRRHAAATSARGTGRAAEREIRSPDAEPGRIASCRTFERSAPRRVRWSCTIRSMRGL